MDTYKLNFTQLQNRIFRLLCINVGKSMNQRDIATSLKVSSTAVSQALKLLGKVDLVNIKKDKKMNLLFISLNRDNNEAIYFKRIENLNQIYESGFVKFMNSKFPLGSIILFGSYSLGEDNVDSDIDIAIIGEKERDLNLDSFEKQLDRKIQMNFYSNLKNVHKHLKENLINGVVLKGFVEL